MKAIYKLKFCGGKRPVWDTSNRAELLDVFFFYFKICSQSDVPILREQFTGY